MAVGDLPPGCASGRRAPAGPGKAEAERWRRPAARAARRLDLDTAQFGNAAQVPTIVRTLSWQNLAMHGLYDGDFVGYKIAASGEVDAALNEAVVAVDASVLLDLYRFRPQTSRDLINTLRSLGDRLVVPHQALREFWRRRQRVQDSPGGATKTATDALDKSGRSIGDALDNWA